MGKALFVCNTVYQVLVSVWIKHRLLNDKKADIIVSDHMNNYQTICDNLNKTGVFDKAYSVDTKEYVLLEFLGYKEQLKQCADLLSGDRALERFVSLNGEYDELYVSNFDRFIDVLFNTLIKKNSDLKFNLFEDGISTYCRYTQNRYKRKMSARVLKRLIGIKVMNGSLSSCYVFNPKLMDWKPCENIIEIPKIDEKDTDFLEKINMVFGYEQLEDTYEEKYIFFEESFYADTGYMEDVELVNKIADEVGKENLLIKIHPRNPENRFEKLGYKTNKNTAIPWEVIAMNIDISNKKLLTIGSASVLNTVSLLDKGCECFSFIKCISEKPELLKTELGEKILSCFEKNDNIKIIDKKMWVLK